MNGEKGARAATLVRFAVAALCSCSSHVDVGFTNEGGVAGIADASGSRGDEPVAAVMTACSITLNCTDAGGCEPMITYAPWCTEVCKSSIKLCNGECVDTSSDHDNCGRCRHECLSNETCVMGGCVP
jgi:hypothetical protein